jgi:hypothetical protein
MVEVRVPAGLCLVALCWITVHIVMGDLTAAFARGTDSLLGPLNTKGRKQLQDCNASFP